MDGIPPVPLAAISDPRHDSLARVAADHLQNGLSSRQSSQAAEEFEGVFVSLLLKTMRTTLGENGFFGSEGSDTYGGLFDLYMGKHLAASDALGIGQMMQTYLANAASTDNSTEAASPNNLRLKAEFEQ